MRIHFHIWGPRFDVPSHTQRWRSYTLRACRVCGIRDIVAFNTRSGLIETVDELTNRSLATPRPSRGEDER